MITFEPTPRQAAALAAACDAHNAANRAALTPSEFAALIIARELDGYADSLNVGLITPYEFVERFQRLGVYGTIFDLSKTDPHVADYLKILREKNDDVNLFSPTVRAGVDYLVAAAVLTQEQADTVRAV